MLTQYKKPKMSSLGKVVALSEIATLAKADVLKLQT